MARVGERRGPAGRARPPRGRRRAPASPRDGRARCASPVTLDHRRAPLVAPDHGRPEDGVAEGVVVVAVGVDDDADARRAELAQVVEDLAGLRRRACACPRPAPRRRPAPPRCPGRRSGSGGRRRGRRSRSSAWLMRRIVSAADARTGYARAHEEARHDRSRHPAGTVHAVRSRSAPRMADGTILRTLHWAAAGEPVGRRARRPRPRRARRPVRDGRAAAHGAPASTSRPTTSAATAAPAGRARPTWSAGPILHDDLAGAAGLARASAYPDRPLVLYGHSLGGLIARRLRALRAGPCPLPDLLVLSAPGPGRRPCRPGSGRWRGGARRGVVPKMKLANGGPGDGLSRDPAVSDAYVDADPLCLDYVHRPLRAPRRSRSRTGSGAALAALDADADADLRPPRLGRPDRPGPAASAVLEGKGNVTRRGPRRPAPRVPPRARARGGPRRGGRLAPAVPSAIAPGGVDSADNRISASGERATR